eukprot:COSAG01_NODE_33576_length_562_cov_0.667387_1_plen_75_part_00
MYDAVRTWLRLPYCCWACASAYDHPPPRPPRPGFRSPVALLHKAAGRANVPGVQAKLQRGVDPDLPDRGWAAFR